MIPLLKALFEAGGIDFDQWRALTRAALRMDLRTTRVYGAGAAGKSRDSVASRFIGQGILYVFMGVAAALLVFFVDDVMLSATLVIVYVMFMVGAMVLVDHQSVITSPDDYLVIGPRPVSSRTYFAVRLANVLVYAMALTTLYGVLPILAFGVGATRGFRPGLVLAAIPALYLATTFTVLVLVFCYAGLVRAIGADRLSRALSYVQLVIGVLIYGGYMLPGEIMRLQHAGFAMPESPWLLLFPPTWFASYVAIANGSVGLRQLLPATASIVAIAALARGLGGRLSLEYAERLGAIASSTASRRADARRARRPLWFRTGERRVVSLLVRAQFRNDLKFRMAVLGVLPLTLLYMYLSFQQGAPADPFSPGDAGMSGWSYVTMAVLFFPMTLRLSLIRSDAYRASWIYFGTPASRGRILQAQSEVVMIRFVLPYLAVVAAAMTWLTRHPVSVLVHVSFLGLASLLLLQSVTLASPELPFSLPPEKLSRSGSMLVWFMIIPMAGLSIGPLLAWLVYVSVVRTVIAALLLVAASLALDRLTRARMHDDAEQLEFSE